jgi:hypothetical protein
MTDTPETPAPFAPGLTLAELQDYAEKAERFLRVLHPKGGASPTGKLPEALEKALALYDVSTAAGAIGRYAMATHFRMAATEKPAEGGGTGGQTLQSDEAAYALVTRAPVAWRTEGGRTHPVTTKSLESYDRLAGYSWECALLDEEIATLERLGRIRDLLRLSGLRRQRLEVVDDLLAVALYDGIDAPDDVRPPAGVSARTVTHADLHALQMAHFELGPMRLAALHNPEDESSKSDPSRSGFAFFLAAIAKRGNTTVARVARDDIHARIAESILSREAPGAEGGEGNDAEQSLLSSITG